MPASNRRQFSRSESYFFFLATLRVFFAVFFTALFAFFAFLAFLAMLPSDVEMTNRCVHSGIEMHAFRIHQHMQKNSVSLKEVLTRGIERAHACSPTTHRRILATMRKVRENAASANVNIAANTITEGVFVVHAGH